MSLNPFTGNWIFSNVSKIIDINFDESGNRQTRNNWTLTRYRFTNEQAETQLRTEQLSVSAYSGDEWLTENASANNFMWFDTTQNWTDSSYRYMADYSVPFTSETWGGDGTDNQYAFILDEGFENKPDSTKITVVRPVLTLNNVSPNSNIWTWVWEAGEWDVGSTDWHPKSALGFIDHNRETGYSGSAPYLSSIVVDAAATEGRLWRFYTDNNVTPSGTLQWSDNDGSSWTTVGTGYTAGTVAVTNEISMTVGWISPTTSGTAVNSTFYVNPVPAFTTTTNYSRGANSQNTGANSNPAEPPAVTGLFSNHTGTFTGNSTATDAGVEYPARWMCTNDVIEHVESVGWWKQTQTWQYKDEFRDT